MNIRVDLNYPINDGVEVVFRSPVDCSQVTGLKVYYPKNGATASNEFAFADAHGNNVGDIDHLFAENVVVKVILDVTTGMAFVQNADTNAYLEGRFGELEDKIGSGGIYIGIGDMPDNYNVQIDPDGEPVDLEEEIEKAISTQQKKYELIETITLDEDMAIERTQEPDGTPYKFERMFLKIRCVSTATPNIRFYCMEKQSWSLAGGVLNFDTATSTMYGAVEAYPYCGYWFTDTHQPSTDEGRYLSLRGGVSALETTVEKCPYLDRVVSLGTLPAGTTVAIWGVRV